MTSEWDDLVGCLTSQMEAPYGLLSPDRILKDGSIGNDVEYRGRQRLKSLIQGLVDQASMLADAFDQDADQRDPVLIAFIPSRSGSRPHAVATWRAPNGLRFLASTLPMPHLVSVDARFSTVSHARKCTECSQPPIGWA